MADRYTVLQKDIRDIPEIVGMASKLGMCWHIEDFGESRCSVYLFFDEQGKTNYLGRIYGDATARLIKAIEDFAKGNVGPVQSLLDYTLQIRREAGR